MRNVALFGIPFTFRQRNLLLLFGGVSFCGLVYWVSIRQTVDLYQANQQLEQQLENARRAPGTIRALENHLHTYESALKNFNKDALRRDEYFLDQLTLTGRRNQVQLVSLPVSQLVTQDDFETETRVVKMKGGFSNLLRVVYDAEFRLAIGRISSVRFSTEEDRRSHTMELFVYLYIQNLHVAHEKDK